MTMVIIGLLVNIGKNEISYSQKAYQIDLGKIREGFLYSEIDCYAETHTKAKSKLLKQVNSDYYDMYHNYTDEKITYLNIPVLRKKLSDTYIFEGAEMTLYRIETLKNERIRIAELDKILEDSSISYCYIKKGSYYRPNSCGYTDFITNAGVYTKKDAVLYAKSVSSLVIIPINIDEHNKMLNGAITDLQSRLL